MRMPLSVGVVGLGFVGRKLARIFADMPQADLRALCDGEAETRTVDVAARYPGARVTAELDDLLSDESLDAVAVATPTATHHELARRALEADKHVLVERPLALSADEAEDLVELARRRSRRLLVGHTLVFDPAIAKLKELIHLGHLGDVYYLSGSRHDPGRTASDGNVLWSLGADVVAAIMHLLDDQPVETSACGECYVEPGIADVASCHLKFATGVSAYLHVSWLDAEKTGRLMAVGSRRAGVLDEAERERRLTIYDNRRTADRETLDRNGALAFGDIVCPRVPLDEPLRLECEHFVSSIRGCTDGPGGGAQAARVVAVLEALQQSLDETGSLRAVDAVLRSAPHPARAAPALHARGLRAV